jgi:hypothetical protein
VPWQIRAGIALPAGPAPYCEGKQKGIMRLRIWETRRSEGMMRFIVGILWIILMVFIILVVLNIPGIR